MGAQRGWVAHILPLISSLRIDASDLRCYVLGMTTTKMMVLNTTRAPRERNVSRVWRYVIRLDGREFARFENGYDAALELRRMEASGFYCDFAITCDKERVNA